jgi:hypothetical protein
MLLPDQLLESFRAHPLGERLIDTLLARGSLEKIHLAFP